MRTEPVVSAAAVSGLIVTVASLFNVVLDLSTVQTAVVANLPLAFSLLARRKVTPTGRG